MKKRTITMISVCIVTVLIGSVLFMFYDKFGTANVFSAALGLLRVTNTNADAVVIREEPQIMIAKPDIELLDRHMETLGYNRVEDKQLGAMLVFSNGVKEQNIMYSQNKYYSTWEWKE